VGRHPFITTLFHRFQDERNIYMVLELVQCGDLWSFIQGNGRLPNEAARFYAAQIVMAVQYLHGEHIMFRDLNPSNGTSSGTWGPTAPIKLRCSRPMLGEPWSSCLMM
jgi:serine/threonine protein kinase